MGAPIDRGFVRTRGRLSLKRRPDLFVCHNSHDKTFAKELARDLAKFGIDPFLDVWELEAGDSLHQSLSIALTKSRFVGVIISPKFARSNWAMDELSETLAREKRTKSKVVIPILYKKAPLLPFLADRLYADFRTDYFLGLIKVCQVVHGLSLSLIDNAISERPPKKLNDVAKILESSGWDSTSRFEAHDVDKFLTALKRHAIPHSLAKDQSFTIDRDELERHWPKLAHLAVAQTFRDLDEDAPPIATFSHLRHADPRAAITLQRTLSALRNRGYSLSDIAKMVDCAPSTIARWAAGTTSPSPFVSSPLVRRLLEHLDELPYNGSRLASMKFIAD
jgi:DNA-binding transcriptional MerR regulator